MNYKSIHSKNYRWCIAKEIIRPAKVCTEPWHKYYSKGIHFKKYEYDGVIGIFIVVKNIRFIINFPYRKSLG